MESGVCCPICRSQDLRFDRLPEHRITYFSQDEDGDDIEEVEEHWGPARAYNCRNCECAFNVNEVFFTP